MKGSAPNLLAAGSQTVPKMPQPSVVNQEAACWVVETAIRTRITRTSRPALSASHRKPRSPRPGARSGRGPGRCPGRPDPLVSLCSLRPDLAELRLGLRLDVGRQRRVAERLEQLLAVTEQVANIGLEHLRGVRAGLL